MVADAGAEVGAMELREQGRSPILPSGRFGHETGDAEMQRGIVLEERIEPSLELLADLLGLVEEGVMLGLRMTGHACALDVKQWQERTAAMRERIEKTRGEQTPRDQPL